MLYQDQDILIVYIPHTMEIFAIGAIQPTVSSIY